MNIYILAGGKSSRMGEDKGLILFRGKPLIQYILDVVATFHASIFIVTANTQYAVFNCPLVSDSTPHLGPAGAIATILNHSDAEQNLVLPCDMPFIDKNSLQYLINASIGADITVPLYCQYPEALMGVYSKACAEKWNMLVAKGLLKLSDLLSYFATTFVDGEAMRENNPHLFVNINSKETLSLYQ